MKCSSSLGCKFVRQFIVLSVYVAIGTVVFRELEKPEELHEISSQLLLEEIRRNLSTKYAANVTVDEFNRLVRQIVRAKRIGELPNWTTFESIDFLVQALTTVGFGNITPRTRGGQGFFLVYALFGVPLNMLTLKTAGELINVWLKKLIRKIDIKLHQDPAKHIQLKLLVVASGLLTSYQMITATALYFTQNWTYLESLYASFVILSTIGFGDYIPWEPLNINMSNSQAVLLGLWIFPQVLLGLTVLMCFFNAYIEYMEYLNERRDQRMVHAIENLQARGLDSTQ